MNVCLQGLEPVELKTVQMWQRKTHFTVAWGCSIIPGGINRSDYVEVEIPAARSAGCGRPGIIPQRRAVNPARLRAVAAPVPTAGVAAQDLHFVAGLHDERAARAVEGREYRRALHGLRGLRGRVFSLRSRGLLVQVPGLRSSIEAPRCMPGT